MNVFSLPVLRLAFSLAQTNFKLRNEGSYLGLLWYILSPLALFLIILFVKQEAFLSVSIPHYPVYLLTGLLIFNIFTQIISSSIVAISSNAGFIKSVKIPTESLVLSKVIQFIFSHIFELVLLALCMSYVGFSLWGIAIGILLYIPVLFICMIFITGIAFIVATLGVYVSDLNNVWMVISQLLFFVTPIFYIPKEGSLLYIVNEYNPLYYFMKLGREALMQGYISSINEFVLVTICSVVSLFLSIIIFEKYKTRFAELV